MGRITDSADLGANLQQVTTLARCAICARHPSHTMFVLNEGAPLPAPHLSWLLCAPCVMAVQEEVMRSALRTPLRVRVAVAIIASERSPRARPKRWDPRSWVRLSDGELDKLVTVGILGLFLEPVIVFIIVTVVTVMWR